MFGIGIIDDEAERRDALLEDFEDIEDKSIANLEPDDWDVIAIPPFRELSDYPTWISENEITAIVLDEKLKNLVGYDGHDLIDYIKPRISWLPIFVLTNYASDESLNQRFEKATDIIEKTEWIKNSQKFAGRVLNAGRDHSDFYVKKHKRLDELSEKAALNEADDGDLRELAALRDEIQLPFDSLNSSREGWLDEFEASVNELEAIVQRAKQRIDSKSKD